MRGVCSVLVVDTKTWYNNHKRLLYIYFYSPLAEKETLAQNDKIELQGEKIRNEFFRKHRKRLFRMFRLW